MFRPSHSRRLRALIADLAQLAPDDLEAILADLDDAQRREVIALMEQFQGASVTVSSEVAGAGRRYSEWIIERLASPDPRRTSPRFALTDTARRTLVDLARSSAELAPRRDAS